MGMVFVPLGLLLALQESFTIPRAQKDVYARCVPESERAAGLIESDPQAALDVLNAILDTAGLEKRECRIRWEISPGTHSRSYDFYPYQWRGRALLQLAKKTLPRDPERARGLLDRAVRDFQTSLDRGLSSSKPLLADATKRLADLTRPVVEDGQKVLVEFKSDWRSRIDAGRFADAQALVDSPRGKALKKEQQEALAEDTREQCRLAIDAAVQQFLHHLRTVSSPRQLEVMAAASFARDFGLPDRSQLIPEVIFAEYLWCTEAFQVLQEFREKKEVVERLLDLALRAVPAEGRPDFGAFGPVERLAYKIVEERISRRAEEARTAPAERRAQLFRESEQLRDRWKTFEGRVRAGLPGDSPFVQGLPARDVTLLLDGFPIEWSVRDEIGKALRESAEAADPDRALADLQARFPGIRADWDRLSVESRREILKYEVIVGALRGLWAGDSPAKVASRLRSVGMEYKSLGGTSDDPGFGTKVLQVFQAITQ